MQHPSIFKPLLNLTSVAVLLTVMHLAASFLLPILLAVFLAMLLTPLHRWLKQNRVPGGLALLLTLGVLVVVALFLIVLVGNSMTALAGDLAGYSDQFDQPQAELSARAQSLDATRSLQSLLSSVKASNLVAPAPGTSSEETVMKLQFLGAARQVTGSCYFVEVAGRRLLVDCGLFQEREFQHRNWDPTPVDPQSLDAVLLTHAHLDHSGRLPRLVKEGFRGRIHTTEPTVELAELVMQHSARLQQEDLAFKMKRHAQEGRQSPHPYEPLYGVEDVEQTMTLMQGVGYDTAIDLGHGVSARFLDAGHILGSAELESLQKAGGQTN